MMKRLFSFLLLTIMTVGMVLPCYATEATINDADDTAVGDVFAKFVRTYTWDEALVEDGTAEVTTGDGYVVTVTGIPVGAVRLIVFSIPFFEVDAWRWLNSCIDQDYKLKNAFDIYFEDAVGNRINANRAQVTIRECTDECEVLSVKTNGQSAKLNIGNKDGVVSFFTDESNYYILTVKNAPTDSAEPDKPTVPDKAPAPATGDNSYIVFWFVLVAVTGVILIWLLIRQKKRERENG